MFHDLAASLLEQAIKSQELLMVPAVPLVCPSHRVNRTLRAPDFMGTVV